MEMNLPAFVGIGAVLVILTFGGAYLITPEVVPSRRGELVTVVNHEPVRYAGRTFVFGDVCRLGAGRSKRIGEDGDKILLSHRATTYTNNPRSRMCIDISYLMNRDEFERRLAWEKSGREEDRARELEEARQRGVQAADSLSELSASVRRMGG